MTRFPRSELADKLLGGLDGIEIGGSAHNAFGLKTRNVDVTADMDTIFKRAEIEMCGEAMPVDIVAPADRLPLPGNSVDFVVSSHVLEHVFDVIGCLLEWDRVVRPGGYIFTIVPKRDALPEDRDRPLTTLAELVERFGRAPSVDDHRHWSVWTHEQGRELINFMRNSTERLVGRDIPTVNWACVSLLETDDKVGNGWCFVVQKATR